MPASARALERARAAVELDVARDFPAAARAYRDAAAALDADADADADGADGLRRKAREYRERADELEATTRETTVDYTSLVGVASGAARAKTTMETKTRDAGGARVVAGAAAVGAGAGFALLGPVSAVVGAGAMAYGTTRRDGVGSACSGAGKLAANAYSSVKRWNREHAVTTKAAAACATGAKAVKKLDDEYKIREKTAKAVTGTARAASEFNEKHGVTKKIGEGVSVGLDVVTKKLGGVDARDEASSEGARLPSAPR